MRQRIALVSTLLLAFVGLSACTPDELEAAKQLGIDPVALAQQSTSAIQVILPPRRDPSDVPPPPPAPPALPTTAPPVLTPISEPLPPLPGEPVTPVVPVDRYPTDDQLYRLRWCESTNNYRAVSPGGQYRGAYQFDRATWNGVAARWYPQLVGVDPAGAAPNDQDAMARALYKERGWQPWPVCGAEL